MARARGGCSDMKLISKPSATNGELHEQKRNPEVKPVGEASVGSKRLAGGAGVEACLAEDGSGGAGPGLKQVLSLQDSLLSASAGTLSSSDCATPQSC